VAVVIGAARGHAEIYLAGDFTSAWRLALSPAIGLGLGLVVVFLTRLSVHRFDWARQLHNWFRGLLGQLGARDVFVLAIASSVGEELFFRGALVPWIGVPAAAAVFALAHIGPGLRYLPWTASALALGMLFGFLFNGLGDLGAPVVAHFTINYLNIEFILRTELPA
jgi:membrane protease YdiL (CAAX protease family)